LNTSVNLFDNANSIKKSELENKIKRVNLPIPDKQKHRKNKSQIYEQNIATNFETSSGANNLNNFEKITSSTKQSYEPINTIGLKSKETSNKRVSVINESK
jgi:hypothetical protein